MDQGVAVLIAATMAILGIFYTSRQQRKLLRKQHTYKVLEKMNDWEKLDECLDFASSLIKAGEVPRLCDDSHKNACERIDFILNHYEFLSAAIISGDIDEALVRGVEETRLTRVFLKFIAYVAENREDRNSDKVWENLEFMCHRWAIARPDSYDRSIEHFMLKPSLAYFQPTRSQIWNALAKKAAETR